MAIIGFLHTADVHVATFQQLMAELAPRHRHTAEDRSPAARPQQAGQHQQADQPAQIGERARIGERHLVDERLLADARADGMTSELVGRLHARLAELATAGADLIVCTCSTIGAAAEEAADTVGVPVLRADRPMADAAVAAGKRIAVVASVESTMEPTMALLRQSAERAGAQVTLVAAPCYCVWQHFESGDHERYFAAVAAHVRTIVDDVDVVVLAQASMAPAAALLPGLKILTSPRTAVTAALSHWSPSR